MSLPSSEVSLPPQLLPTKAYRILVCEKNRTRGVAQEWVYDRQEVQEQKRAFEKNDPDHDFCIEESNLVHYLIRWSVQGTPVESTNEAVLLLPEKDFNRMSHSVLQEYLGHDRFIIRSSRFVSIPCSR
jgi:hypothetical protein